jgi:acylphosphatase
MSAARKSVRMLISGRVQGVWFRAWTVERAKALGLDGWVRNRCDGAVEAVFAGDADLVEHMMKLCHEGPPAARVDHIDVLPYDETPPRGFTQKPTA